MKRRIALYFSWDRAAEVEAPLGDLNNRFPALFEVRRTFWPAYEALAHAPGGQDINGFLEAIFLQNYRSFGEDVAALTGMPLRQIQRQTITEIQPLNAALLETIDTLIIISFDSKRTGQAAEPAEIAAIQAFLQRPETMLFVCPHHDIGDVEGLAAENAPVRQVAEFRHHGDVALPGQQRLGGFGMSLMEGLGAPIRNRFGLRPARTESGDPAPLRRDADDRFGLLSGVDHLNLHPHLPHFERVGRGATVLEVLARQVVSSDAPTHPVMNGGSEFDAILQSSTGAGLGRLVICDATLWASTFGGLDGVKAYWKNVITA
jgi:hypothetical protein